jgi:hypothetical protein
MLHFISNLSDTRNLIVATSGESFWLHWNDGSVRYQAKAKSEAHAAKIGAEAYTVETLIAAAEAGSIDWTLFWPEEIRGEAIVRKDAERPQQAQAKGF